MYGKHFASAYTGSMMGAGADVFAVWGYVIANTSGGQVELNPSFVGMLVGMTPEAVSRAIEYLCAPDPRSRSKAEDGRRLVREGEFAYRVPTWEAYRKVRNEEERREYNRIKQREHRSKKSEHVKARVNDSNGKSKMSTMSAHAETEAEAETETKTSAPIGAPTRSGRPTWLTPYAVLWRKYCGGKIPFEIAARNLRPLHDDYGEAEVLTRLERYLQGTNAQYLSLPKFASTFGVWDRKNVVRGTRHEKNMAVLKAEWEKPDGE